MENRVFKALASCKAWYALGISLATSSFFTFAFFSKATRSCKVSWQEEKKSCK